MIWIFVLLFLVNSSQSILKVNFNTKQNNKTNQYTIHVFTDQWPNGCHNCKKDINHFVTSNCNLKTELEPLKEPYYLVQETHHYNIYSATNNGNWECITTQVHNAYINEQPMWSKGPYGYIVGLTIVGVIVLILLIFVVVNYLRRYRHRVQNQVHYQNV